MKQQSSQVLEIAMKKEQSLSMGEAIDNFMPTENVLQMMASIDQTKEREIAALQKSDPQYEKKK